MKEWSVEHSTMLPGRRKGLNELDCLRKVGNGCIRIKGSRERAWNDK